MNPGTKLVTADDLWQLPENGRHYDLVKGELQPMAPAGGEHGGVTIYLTVPLGYHVDVQDQGVVLAAETGFILERDPDTVRGADIAFVRKDRIPAGGLPKSYIPFAPDLAVEVVSPNDTMEEVEEKVVEWLTAGTKAVWVVLPKQRIIKVYRTPTSVRILTVNDELDGEDVVPGFRLPVNRVFR
jgi:Uma2 family endonuclease